METRLRPQRIEMSIPAGRFRSLAWLILPFALCGGPRAEGATPTEPSVDDLLSALTTSRTERQQLEGELGRLGVDPSARPELSRRAISTASRIEALEWRIGELQSERVEMTGSGQSAAPGVPGEPSPWALGELLGRPREVQPRRVRATWHNWRVSGDVFTGVRGDNSERNGFDTETSGVDWGATVNLRGFAIDPRFMTFDAGFDLQEVSNDLNRQETDFTVAGYRLQTHWLPERPWPFSFRVRRSDVDSLTSTDDRRFDFGSDYMTLGASWQLRLPRLPKVSLSYDDTSGDSVFSDRASNSESSNRSRAASASHTWLGWTWSGGYVRSDNVIDLGPGGRTERELDQVRFNAHTQIGATGRLAVSGFHQEGRDLFSQPDGLGEAIDLVGQDSFLAVNADHRHSPRLRGSYRYTWSKSEFGEALGTVQSDDFFTQVLGANLRFEWTGRLTLFWDAGVQTFADGEAPADFPDQLYTFGPGVAYRRTLGKVALNGSYQPVWHQLTTTLDETATFWSHILRLGAEAGDRDRLHTRADYRFSDIEQVTRIGAFHRQSVFRLRLTSARFEPLVLSGSVKLSKIELLNLAGRQDLDDLGWDFSIKNRILGLSLGHSSASGNGFVFADPLDGDLGITDPLPVNTLVPSPFLRRESRQSYVTGRLRPHAKLQLTAAYRTELSEFVVAPDLDRDRWEIFAEYKLGRFTITGSYLREDLLVGGDRIDRDRHYLRIIRSFSFFPFLARS